MTRRTEEEIMKNWPADGGEPLVTVAAICYCHEKYLRAALDSILAQETDFPFEVLVHDDVSPDGSVAIIQEYAAAYPHIIRPLLETENQFSKGSKAFSQALAPHIRGKYMAYLECDDFWTDPHKLQTQVDFLEAHPAYLAVAHNCTVVDGEGKPTGEQYPECKDEEYTFDHFLHNIMPGQSGTLVTRSHLLKSPGDYPLFQTVPPGGPFDRALYLTLLFGGRVCCIQKSMSAYRHITSGGTSYSATYRFDLKREALFYLTLVLYCKRMGGFGEAIGLQRWLIDFIERFVKAGRLPAEEAAPCQDLCRTSIRALEDRLEWTERRCPCCGQPVQYEILPIEQQEAPIAHGCLLLPETFNPDACLCPNCGGTDRDRLMAAALKRMELREKMRDYRILHLAPSPALERWFRENCPDTDYETCDVSAESRELSALPDASFDLILCSHVLEHVRDDRKALSELKRILKDEGRLLFLSAIDRGFSGVDEAWGLSEEENWRRFGQGDRCRRYGRDGLLARVREQFSVQILEKDFFGEDCFREAALSDSSALYVFSKPGYAAAFADAREERQRFARLVLYLRAPEDAGYSESKRISLALPLQSEYRCTIPLDACGTLAHIRLDPMEQPCFLRNIAVHLTTEAGETIPVPIQSTNGLPCLDGLVFNNDDPQLELGVPQGRFRSLAFSAELLSVEGNELGYLFDTAAQAAAAQQERALLVNSLSWRITKPLRVLLSAIKKLFQR